LLAIRSSARLPSLGAQLAACLAVSAGGENRDVESVMQLIVYYLVFMIVGDLCAYLIGLVTERAFGGQVSLIVFLTLYFLFLWISWVLAVWITEPKHAATTTEQA
jgi:cation transporter-like permease